MSDAKAVRPHRHPGGRGAWASAIRGSAALIQLAGAAVARRDLAPPLDSEVTHGHRCVKGRFGFEFVQRRRREE